MNSALAKTNRPNRIAEILRNETPTTGAAIRIIYTPQEIVDAASEDVDESGGAAVGGPGGSENVPGSA